MLGAGLNPVAGTAAVFYPRRLYRCRALRAADDFLGRHTSLGAAFVAAVGRK
jgi:hypothetical protein